MLKDLQSTCIFLWTLFFWQKIFIHVKIYKINFILYYKILLFSFPWEEDEIIIEILWIYIKILEINKVKKKKKKRIKNNFSFLTF